MATVRNFEFTRDNLKVVEIYSNGNHLQEYH
jgi:hypothetical protein